MENGAERMISLKTPRILYANQVLGEGWREESEEGKESNMDLELLWGLAILVKCITTPAAIILIYNTMAYIGRYMDMKFLSMSFSCSLSFLHPSPAT